MLKRIPLDLIDGNPDQPRKKFDDEELAGLASSIEQNGLQQPIKVRPAGEGRYQIIMGERRWRAHKQLLEDAEDTADIKRWSTILANVERMNDLDTDINALVENVSRKDLTPFEEAQGYKRLFDQGLTVEEIAKRMGKQYWRITDRLSLLGLQPEYQLLLTSGQITATQAFEMSRLNDPEDQHRMFRAMKANGIQRYNEVRAVATTILEDRAQLSLVAEAAPTEKEHQTVNAIERKVDQVSALCRAGFTDGELTIAHKVNPDKARTMADRLDLISSQLVRMAEALRSGPAQGELEAA
ncbi:MAG: ParB/RepB/Spo0J family partition protein [Alphaproteobacteria bacterium]|nr:ParB/RepB/Spo0J family partition protein [Alphaproteobacteria bacterium]